MGFWDSVKAGFYRSAGVDDDSMKVNDEVRGLRSELAAPSDAQHDEIRAYMQFVNGTLGSLEPDVMHALPMALQGDDADRVAWGLEAGPRCRIVRTTLNERRAPTPGATLLQLHDSEALMWYGFLADEWIKSAGVHTENAERYRTTGTARWDKAVSDTYRLGGQLALAR